MLGDGIGSNIRKSKLINRRMFIASTAKAIIFFGLISSKNCQKFQNFK